MLDKPNIQKIKNIFKSSFTLCILTKIHARYSHTNISSVFMHPLKIVESGFKDMDPNFVDG